jgi:hypothetical protein
MKSQRKFTESKPGKNTGKRNRHLTKGELHDAREALHAVRPTRRVAGLLGFLVKGEVDAIFDQHPFEPVPRGADVMELWQQSAVARETLPPLASFPGEVDTLPDEMAPVVESIKKRRTYRRSYERLADYHFGTVPIAALLTPQWYADLEYVAELAERVRDEMDAADLLAFAMPEGFITEPIVRGNQVVFTSQRLDLNAIPVPDVRDVGDGELEIVVRASSRPNYVQVAVLNERLVLVNGVHKVLALHSHGHDRVPCVWRRVHDLGETGLNLQTSLFMDQTFKGPRPALVLDLLDNRVAVPLLMRSMYQVMMLSIGLEAFQVPALQGTP